MARVFDGTDDEIRTLIGGCNIAPPLTFAVILRRTGTGTPDAIMSLWDTVDSDPTYGIYIDDDDTFRFERSGDLSIPVFTCPNTDGWIFLAAGKTSGSAQPRFHKYRYTTNAWSHQNGNNALVDAGSAGAGGVVQFGVHGSAGLFGAIDLLCAALFDRLLTDAETEQLAFTWQTWLAMAPVGAWLFDQSTTAQSVLDWTGRGANQNAITGTAIGTSHPPLFSRTGALAARQSVFVAPTGPTGSLIGGRLVGAGGPLIGGRLIR